MDLEEIRVKKNNRKRNVSKSHYHALTCVTVHHVCSALHSPEEWVLSPHPELVFLYFLGHGFSAWPPSPERKITC